MIKTIKLQTPQKNSEKTKNFIFIPLNKKFNKFIKNQFFSDHRAKQKGSSLRKITYL